MKRICVYCGSKPGRDPRYVAGALAMGRAMHARDIGLVYGGGSVGMMGAIADEIVGLGGDVIGVIPQGLVNMEAAHPGLDDLRVVDSMHTRKALMEQLSDGFIAMPGGIGTFEELFEIMTWLQLGVHKKPIGVLNLLGYFDPIIAMLDHSVDQGFLKSYGEMVLVADDPDALLDLMADWVAPDVPQWINEAQT